MPRRKIPAGAEEAIRERFEAGEARGAIASDYGVSVSRIYQIAQDNPGGDPEMITPSLSQRFWARVERGTETECWNWRGARTATNYTGVQSRPGYGVMTNGSSWSGSVYTHRLAWILTYGPIPRGLCVCHHCDNGLCCNPRHLFVGTHLDNMRDMVAKGRGRKAHPKPRRQWGRSDYNDAKTLDCIRDHQAAFGASPTLRQIAAALGLADESCALRRVRRLETAGLITRDPMDSSLAALGRSVRPIRLVSGT